jgi:hypothetical protein
MMDGDAGVRTEVDGVEIGCPLTSSISSNFKILY